MNVCRCAKNISNRGALAQAHHRRLIAAHATPVEDAEKTQQRTSRAIEVLGSREVCFLNDDGDIAQIDVNVEDHSNRTVVQRVTGFASDMLLPDGYPETLTPDYLRYQLWTLPVHVTGWISNSLVTSSLLKAAGLGTGAAGTVAAGAAIKWITKDGIGALGRVLVGSSLARYFDEDPRFWRIVADIIKAGGQALEVATAATPSAFVLLASTGNFAKAAGKGIGRPAFRVIQNHFATRGNVGDVAAREEIWEVTAQLVGLAASVALLRALDAATSAGADAAATVIGTWAVVQGAHLILRYKALATLELPWISQRRAVTLCAAYVRGELIPGVRTTCEAEQFAVPKQLQRPNVLVNATLAQVSDAAAALPFQTDASTASSDSSSSSSNGSGGNGNGVWQPDSSASNGAAPAGNGAAGTSQHAAQGRPANVLAALDMYGDDDYVLLPILDAAVPLLPGPSSSGAGNGAGQGGTDGGETAFVMAVKAGCNERSMGKLLGVLQAVWMCQHRGEFAAGPAGSLTALRAAQEWVRCEGGRFEDELRAAGWDVSRVAMWSQQRCVIAVDSVV
eukprot:jgi/Ulvmu1/10991/UM007_0171.1